MIIVKLTNGNVILKDSSGNVIKRLISDSFIQWTSDTTVDVYANSDKITTLVTTEITGTEIEPAAVVPFTGNAYDLLDLLVDSFFFRVTGGGGSQDLAQVLSVGNSAGTYDIDVNNNDLLNVNTINGVSVNKIINLASASPNSTHTGDTNNTLMYSKLIALNTIDAGDVINIDVKFNKNTAHNGTPTVRLYINTSASLSGATLLATYTSTSANFRYIEINRIINVDGATSAVISPSTSFLTDKSLGSNSAVSDVSIDWTVDQYFIVAIQLASSADNLSLRMVNVILNKTV